MGRYAEEAAAASPGAGGPGGLPRVRGGHKRRAPGSISGPAPLFARVPSDLDLCAWAQPGELSPAEETPLSTQTSRAQRQTVEQFQTSGINIAIKQVTRSFGFPIHKKVLSSLSCGLLSVQ